MKRERLKPQKSMEQQIRFKKYHALKKLLPQHISLPLDGILCAATGSFHLDVFRLEKQIPNYNSDTCVYKGKKNYSMAKAIEEEWGEEAMNLINDLL